jgi:hypothetical protein
VPLANTAIDELRLRGASLQLVPQNFGELPASLHDSRWSELLTPGRNARLGREEPIMAVKAQLEVPDAMHRRTRFASLYRMIPLARNQFRMVSRYPGAYLLVPGIPKEGRLT